LDRHNSAAAAQRGPRAKQSYERGATNPWCKWRGINSRRGCRRAQQGCAAKNGLHPSQRGREARLVSHTSQAGVRYSRTVQRGTPWMGQPGLKLKKTSVITLRLRLKLPPVLP